MVVRAKFKALSFWLSLPPSIFIQLLCDFLSGTKTVLFCKSTRNIRSSKDIIDYLIKTAISHLYNAYL